MVKTIPLCLKIFLNIYFGQEIIFVRNKENYSNMSLLTNKYKNLTFKITRDREENTPHLRKLEDSSLQGFKEFFKHLKI